MLLQNYVRIKDELDREYKIPFDPNFTKREFSDIRWPNSRSRNFFAIMKVLCERGFCTVTDIVENDQFSSRRKLKKRRHDVYDRLIKGEEGKFRGLIEKLLIIPEKPDWKNTKNNRYRLSIFGILYTIHLFSLRFPETYQGVKYVNQIEYLKKISTKDYIGTETKYKKSILDVLAQNYGTFVPLIFGKFDFLSKELGSRVNTLVMIAHLEDPIFNELDQEPFINSRPLNMLGWAKPNYYSEEFTMLFFGYLSHRLNHNELAQILKKDSEIFEWYTRYLSFLLRAKDEERLRIRLMDYTIKGDFERVEQIIKKLYIIQVEPPNL